MRGHRREPEIPADPFGERRGAALRVRMRLLGALFQFETDSRELLEIVRQAYGKLPAHELSAHPPRLRVRLLLGSPTEPHRGAGRGREPALVRPLAVTGMLGGASDSADFMVVAPRHRTALVAVSRQLLASPYHARYELLEFAVYVLATRVQKLVPLHAGCIGRAGQGILLLGASGAGKSTLAMLCLQQGFEFLAEDSVLVRPRALLATGIASFLHLRPDSLRFVADTDGAAVVRNSPLIRRRSGVEKFEIDLRRLPYRLAREPQRISCVVFLSSKQSRAHLLRRLSPASALERLESSQAYAAKQPGWKSFARQLIRVPAYELRRGGHPMEAVQELTKLLPQRVAVTRAGRLA